MECSQRNGRIDGYRLSYYPTMNSSDDEAILIDGSNTNTYTIVGLQPRVNYTLTLRAIGGNYSLFGKEERRTVKISEPKGIIVSVFLVHSVRYFNNTQVLDYSSTVECMATIA